jgi:serine protease
MNPFQKATCIATAVLCLVTSGTVRAADAARVFVEFTPGQKATVENVVRGAGGSVHYTFDDLNAFAVSVPAAAIAGLQRNPNIVLLEEDPPRYLLATEVAPYGIDMIGATEVWDANDDGVIDDGAPTGAGIKVGVIDSGLFSSHEDFAGVAVTGEPADWTTDGFGHGTHVTGTITAALNAIGVVGVSPGAVSVHMVKVFDANNHWIYASTLIDAANKCRDAGCKVINMSLGGLVRSNTENRGFQKLYDAGILNVAAAGNDGNKRTSYPAGYDSVISVAAIDNARQAASFSQRNNDVELAAPGVGVLSTVPYIDENTVTVGAASYSGSHLEFSARGTASGVLVDGGRGTATNLAWAGKVVLIERGDITFYEKVLNVQNSGGVGCVIYNDVAGGFEGTLGEGNSATIPAFGLNQRDGEALKTAFGAVATLTSTLTSNVSGYAYYDGTSMACPHVAAAAAVIWSASPSRTNVEIRTALQATAEDLGRAGRDSTYGFGLIHTKRALDYLLAH